MGVRPRVLQALGLVLWLAALLVGWRIALAPGDGSTTWFEHADKLMHAVAFAAYAVLADWAGVRPRWVWATALLAYGVAIEWAQGSVPGREPSWGDVLADAVGIALGALVCVKLLPSLQAAWRKSRG